jgi:hypothetical protein
VPGTTARGCHSVCFDCGVRKGSAFEADPEPEAAQRFARMTP